jgi:hypothetical protein
MHGFRSDITTTLILVNQSVEVIRKLSYNIFGIDSIR